MKDLKYLAAFTIPAAAMISIYFEGYWSFFTPAYAFLLIPVLEVIMPEDASNSQGKERAEKQTNRLFDWML